MSDWNDFDAEAARAAIQELSTFNKTNVSKLTSIEALRRVIAAAYRCANTITVNAGALSRLPELQRWQTHEHFRSRANAVVDWAEARIRQRESIAANRASRTRDSAARILAKAEVAALLKAERAKANAEARAMRAEAKAQAASIIRAAPTTHGGFRKEAIGAHPVRWMAWVGDEIAVTIDGETALGTVTSISRGPVLHVTLTDDRVIALAISARQERPKRRSPRKPGEPDVTTPPLHPSPG